MELAAGLKTELREAVRALDDKVERSVALLRETAKQAAKEAAKEAVKEVAAEVATQEATGAGTSARVSPGLRGRLSITRADRRKPKPT